METHCSGVCLGLCDGEAEKAGFSVCGAGGGDTDMIQKYMHGSNSLI